MSGDMFDKQLVTTLVVVTIPFAALLVVGFWYQHRDGRFRWRNVFLSAAGLVGGLACFLASVYFQLAGIFTFAVLAVGLWRSRRVLMTPRKEAPFISGVETHPRWLVAGIGIFAFSVGIIMSLVNETDVPFPIVLFVSATSGLVAAVGAYAGLRLRPRPGPR